MLFDLSIKNKILTGTAFPAPGGRGFAEVKLQMSKSANSKLWNFKSFIQEL